MKTMLDVLGTTTLNAVVHDDDDLCVIVEEGFSLSELAHITIAGCTILVPP